MRPRTLKAYSGRIRSFLLTHRESHRRSARFCFHKPGPEGNTMHCITAWSTLEQPLEVDTCHMPIS